MIGRLRGQVVESTPGRVILEAAGVGYEVHVPVSAAARLPAGTVDAVLWIHSAASDGGIDLYGFLVAGEREAFRHIIGVSGIGPKTALALLSALTLDDLRAAIVRNDIGPLLAVPGVGKKTAQRILLELREKALAWSAGPLGLPEAATPSRAEDDRAIAALTNLGYRPAQAQRAVEIARQKLGEAAAFEDLVRRALQEAV